MDIGREAAWRVADWALLERQRDTYQLSMVHRTRNARVSRRGHYLNPRLPPPLELLLLLLKLVDRLEDPDRPPDCPLEVDPIASIASPSMLRSELLPLLSARRALLLEPCMSDHWDESHPGQFTGGAVGLSLLPEDPADPLPQLQSLPAVPVLQANGVGAGDEDALPRTGEFM